MAERTMDGGPLPEGRDKNLEPALGGADAVPKTTYGVGSGADPRDRVPVPDRPQGEGTEVGKLSAQGRKAALGTVALMILAVALVYLLGFRR